MLFDFWYYVLLLFSVIATLVLAFATFCMASHTRRSADETARMALYTKTLAEATAAKTELDIEYEAKPRFVSHDPIWDRGLEFPAKHFRVIVRNKGEHVAERCEGKIEVYDEKHNIVKDPALLHWARRFPPMSPKKPSEKSEEVPESPKETPLEHLIYLISPVDIGRDDWEYLDTFYCYGYGDLVRCCINSDRTRFGWTDEIEKKGTYWAKVTVYCENAITIRKWFKLSWTGTLEDTQMVAENPLWI